MTKFTDWVVENQRNPDCAWVMYRLYNGGTSRDWRFMPLDTIKQHVAKNPNAFCWVFAATPCANRFLYWRRDLGWVPSRGVREHWTRTATPIARQAYDEAADFND